MEALRPLTSSGVTAKPPLHHNEGDGGASPSSTPSDLRQLTDYL